MLNTLNCFKLRLRRIGSTQRQYGRLFSSRSFLLANTLFLFGVGSVVSADDREEKIKGLRELINVANNSIRPKYVDRRTFPKAQPTSMRGRQMGAHNP